MLSLIPALLTFRSFHFIMSVKGKKTGAQLFMEQRSATAQGKKLKHVKVYDRIYEQIRNGVYPAGSQLPSEMALAEQMGVSRMTLRKALSLFIEDGIIKNVPGVGHFICDPDQEHHTKLDLSKNAHPIYSYCMTQPDSTELEFRIEPPTRAILDTLEQYTPAVVIADRWYKKDNTVFAYSLSFLPIEQIAEKHIDLTQPAELLAYLNEGCYRDISSCRRICSHSTAGNFTAKNYTLSERDSFLLIQENIYDHNGRILISGKHYIPSELYRIEIALP